LHLQLKRILIYLHFPMVTFFDAQVMECPVMKNDLLRLRNVL
jgi:hypothetical protein